MIERFAQFPRALASQARLTRVGEIPVLLAHPDWSSPRPVMIWMHGRTANKEIDPGRYLRWIRAGLAACAIDLPGHGERALPGWDGPERTPDVLEGVLPEIDAVVERLRAEPGMFDGSRLGIGGMSAGGMAALRRLCDPHLFRCAAVEATCGALGELYAPGRWRHAHDPERVRRLDPSAHLEGWRAIPLLALHAETDRVVAWEIQRGFLARLPGPIEVRTWRDTGAPDEHAGFGRFANDAKNAQVEFLVRGLAG